MSRFKAVWFDLDDTIYDHTYCVCCGLDAVREKFSCFGETPTKELAFLYNRALNTFHTDFLRGEIDFAELRRRKHKLFCELATSDDGKPPALQEFHAVYDEAYALNRRATPGSIQMLESLHKSGVNLGIVTNGMQELQQEKLRVIRLEWMIPLLLTSERAGVTKPDPAIYEWALRETGLNAGKVLMVGDSLENDVKASLRCGISAVLYAPESNERTISTEYGIASIITEWEGLFEMIGEECLFTE